ncbi:hypothetical protein DSO57_1035354 [Entomophthora muscae]|uniref:Uncharacterized protein n=1 Tax=Entomophthora muscae TaxID=34485 RepID=A0ACC2SCX9_9FUNG|nr:hypothetical protein DSO57_1035354 [Entomophthora muscae]
MVPRLVVDFGAVQVYKDFAKKKLSPGPSIEVGDLVYLSTKNIKTTTPCASLITQQTDPYKFLKNIGTVAYRLEMPSQMKDSQRISQLPVIKEERTFSPTPDSENSFPTH